jgi:hypothetical protein
VSNTAGDVHSITFEAPNRAAALLQTEAKTKEIVAVTDVVRAAVQRTFDYVIEDGLEVPAAPGVTATALDTLSGELEIRVEAIDGFAVGDVIQINGSMQKMTIDKIRDTDGHSYGIVLDMPTGCSFPKGTEVKAVFKKAFNVFVQLMPGEARPVDMQAAARIHSGISLIQDEEEKQPLVVVFPERKPPVPIAEPPRGEQIMRHMNRRTRTVDNVGRTTKVVVTITQLPGNGIDELPSIRSIINASCMQGQIIPAIQESILDVTGVKSNLASFKIGEQEIAQWSIQSCSAHMTKVVRRFENAYTRREVPMAIFNECTNYMPALSFSHDMKPTHEDVRRCRESTVKFVNAWNYGNYAQPGWPTTWKYSRTPAGNAMGDWPKVWWSTQLPHLMNPAAAAASLLQENATQNPTLPGFHRWSETAHGFYNGFEGNLRPNKELPMDFNDFCTDICETRYGKDAPWCHAAKDLEMGV